MTVAVLRNSEGQFSWNSAQNAAENIVKHRDGGVGSMVANYRDGSENSVVVPTLLI